MSTAPPLRKTKLVATLGPACDAPDVLVRMIQAGMNVARLNFSHGTRSEHQERVERVRAASQRLGVPVAIMLDTRGIEIRTGEVPAEGVVLRSGEAFSLHVEARIGDASGVSVSDPDLPRDVEPGADVLLDDGTIALRVESVTETEIRCRVERGGTLRSRKGVNLPGMVIERSGISAEGREDLFFAAQHDLDYIAASFVQRPEDVQAIRAVLEQVGADIPIIAKIENRSGVRLLDEIVEIADGTMVARGDLGVELPLVEVPETQKKIIRRTVSSGKPVITATQMLDSMERSAVPTRAEVSDVANAIFDGTSAVMLSGETAIGRYPVEAVRTMSELAIRAEGALPEYGVLQQILPRPSTEVTEAVSQAAATLARNLEATAIVCLTETGFTARAVSRYRPDCPILAVTTSEQVVRRLSLNWGVTALASDPDASDDARVGSALQWARDRGSVRRGDVVVTTAGLSQQTGGTNLIRVVPVA